MHSSFITEKAKERDNELETSIIKKKREFESIFKSFFKIFFRIELFKIITKWRINVINIEEVFFFYLKWIIL